ncbi:MAG TPA: transaldolase [Planctomycetota bacterium]
MKDPLRDAAALGQSVWQDDLSRAQLSSGELAELVDAGVRGITANPTTFEKAFAGGSGYDAPLRELVESGLRDPKELYEELAIRDVQDAADLLHVAYEDSEGRDGLVSFEVSPLLAHDTAGTIEEARRLHRKIARANVMIKVPGTAEGFPAIAELTGLGIHVNVTLLFGVDAYRYAAEAYLAGLEKLVEGGGDPARVASVASFFLSRIDTAVDGLLSAEIESSGLPERRESMLKLLGRTAIANAKIAYAAFQESLRSPRWKALAAWGARPQRPLWASTGVKNPRYPKLMYVEALIGPDTVDTMPRDTLLDFRKHGRAAPTLVQGLDEARQLMASLTDAGVNLAEITAGLVEQGIQLFTASYDKILKSLGAKIRD